MKTREPNDNLELSLESESQKHGLRITVVGVGNGGLRVINTLVKRELGGVNLIAADTDSQVLRENKAQIKIQLGPKKTMGNGAGGNPELGKEATLEVKEAIAGHFKESDLVVVVAMLGKGTGSGGAPEILKTAKERNILTLGLAVMPYEDEGLTEIADTAVKEIARTSDAYMLLHNDNMDQLGEEITLLDAYERMNDVLANSVQALVDIVKQTGYINIHIEDIRAVLGGGGRCLISKSDTKSGEKRASEAIDSAVNDPLIQVSMQGAKNAMVYAMIPKDFKISERKEMLYSIRQCTGGKPKVTFGMSELNAEADGLYVYLVASGISEKKKENAADVDEIDDEELTSIGPAIVAAEEPLLYNQPYQGQARSYNVQPESYRGRKKRPVIEKGKGTHVVTNLLNRKGGHSEFRHPPDTFDFPDSHGLN